MSRGKGLISLVDLGRYPRRPPPPHATNFTRFHSKNIYNKMTFVPNTQIMLDLPPHIVQKYYLETKSMKMLRDGKFWHN